MMNQELLNTINQFKEEKISNERKETLKSLVDYIQLKRSKNETIRLNFICTHNSRRSHLAQIWAQAMSFQFGLQNVYSYSGGTQETAIYSKVIETLKIQGFNINCISNNDNSIYAIKYDENEAPIICFSKQYNHDFNPKKHYAAILTCNSADDACPIVFGADVRIPIKYEDPKVYDGTDLANQKYIERSLEIGNEMWWVFSQIK